MKEENIRLISYLDGKLVMEKTPRGSVDLKFMDIVVASARIPEPYNHENVKHARFVAWEKAFTSPTEALVQAGVDIVSEILPLDEEGRILCAEYLSLGADPMGLRLASIMTHKHSASIFDQCNEAVGAVIEGQGHDLPLRKPFDPVCDSYRLISARTQSTSTNFQQTCVYALLKDGQCTGLVSAREEICAGMTTGVSVYEGFLHSGEEDIAQQASHENEEQEGWAQPAMA